MSSGGTGSHLPVSAVALKPANHENSRLMRALPDQDRSVLAAACYSLAIWADNPSDSIRVTDQRQEFESCNRVPNLDRFIIARRSDATPIGAPGHAVYAIGMPGQHGRYNPGGHVPNANRCTPDTTWTPSSRPAGRCRHFQSAWFPMGRSGHAGYTRRVVSRPD